MKPDSEWSTLKLKRLKNMNALFYTRLKFLISIPAYLVVIAAFGSSSPLPGDSVTAYRIRTDFKSDLDEDLGWGAGISESATINADSPFRIRFEVESNGSRYRRQYSLQYRKNNGEWYYVEAHHFPYPSAKSPSTSIVGCDFFFFGEDAEDLIKVSRLPNKFGAGITLSPTSPAWDEPNASSEWEWALVIRRFSDGPKLANTSDVFSFRMVDQRGTPLSGPAAEIEVQVPDYHVGGTFVETPAQIGPWEAPNGDLYFIMEPAETDNVFMMVKSSDQGKSWQEIDAENRPSIADLEGVASDVASDGTIHILHETSDAVYYHAFCMSGHPDSPDKWVKKDELVSFIEEPPVQVVDVSYRSNDTLVGVYANGSKLYYQIRTIEGKWDPSIAVDPGAPMPQTNPSLVSMPDGTVGIAYKSGDGKGWYRELTGENRLTQPEFISENLGTQEDASMAILPLLYDDETKILYTIFRKEDLHLYLGSRKEGSTWSRVLKISTDPVVTNAVDSDQVGADAVISDGKIYALYISDKDRSLYLSTVSLSKNLSWQTKLIADGMDACWVRGQVLHSFEESPVYGVIYDGGSKGGSGFNRFLKIQLPASR